MPAPFFPVPTTTLGAAGTGAAGYLGWILITGVVGLVAIIGVVRRPAADWPHGLWSKVGWVLVVLYVAIPVGGYPIPLGAIAAIWKTRRPQTPPRAQLPYADGGIWESR